MEKKGRTSKEGSNVHMGGLILAATAYLSLGDGSKFGLILSTVADGSKSYWE